MQLGLTQDTRRAVDTTVLCDAARAAGFSALGMVSGRCTPEDRATFAESGLVCHELLGLQVTADAAGTLATAERLAAEAASIGASWVLATFQVGLSAAVAHTVARCAALVADSGAGLAVEFSPLGPVATIADGVEAIAAAAPCRAGIVIDSWNFCFGGGRWEDLAGVEIETIAYVQFADALEPIAGPTLEEAMTRRAVPGQGVLELDRFAATLRGRGWDGLVSMQVLSDDLRRLPVAEYARLVHDAAVPYWF